MDSVLKKKSVNIKFNNFSKENTQDIRDSLLKEQKFRFDHFLRFFFKKKQRFFDYFFHKNKKCEGIRKENIEIDKIHGKI